MLEICNYKTYKDLFKLLEVVFPRWLEDVRFCNIRHELKSMNSWKVLANKFVPQQKPSSGDCGVFKLILMMYLIFKLKLDFSSCHGQ